MLRGLILLGALLIGSAPSALAAGDWPSGRTVAERWCAQCHVLPGGQAGSDAAPSLTTLAKSPRWTDDALRGFLAQPHPPMPPHTFSNADIETLIAYMARLRTPVKR
jgi:mono/diheme cytochrome c family protein